MNLFQSVMNGVSLVALISSAGLLWGLLLVFFESSAALWASRYGLGPLYILLAFAVLLVLVRSFTRIPLRCTQCMRGVSRGVSLLLIWLAVSTLLGIILRFDFTPAGVSRTFFLMLWPLELLLMHAPIRWWMSVFGLTLCSLVVAEWLLCRYTEFRASR